MCHYIPLTAPFAQWVRRCESAMSRKFQRHRSTRGMQRQISWYIAGRFDDPIRSRFPPFLSVFTIGDHIYTVKTVENYERTRTANDLALDADFAATASPLLIYRSDDVRLDAAAQAIMRSEEEHFCGSDSEEMQRMRMASDLADELGGIMGGGSANSVFVNGSRALRFQDRVGHSHDGDGFSTATTAANVVSGCPTTKKILYMGVFADCR